MLPSCRARTVLATSSHVELGVLGRREVVPALLVDAAGRILLRPGVGRCWDRLIAGEPSPQLDLVATDVTAVPQPDRIRARVRLRGRLEVLVAPPHGRLLRHLQLIVGQPMARLVPDSVVLERPSADNGGSVPVPLPDYAAATIDPLAGWESAWVMHLDSGHAATLRRLVERRLPLADGDRVHALQADSRGVTVRVYREVARSDLRFEFATPAGCGCRGVAEFRDLVIRELGR